jgi:hypothetical protein
MGIGAPVYWRRDHSCVIPDHSALFLSFRRSSHFGFTVVPASGRNSGYPHALRVNADKRNKKG